MKWEKLEFQSENGPGKRRSHTCNSVGGGKYLYVFGGCGQDNYQTNKIHIFDTANRTWSEPVTNGQPPKPRDRHSCTTVEDNLFIFGGTDGTHPLKDLHIFDTFLNTWISPCIRGEGPEAREGHSAALVGKRLFIFGGSGKSSNGSHEEYSDDLYILNTETFVWKRAETSGNPPAKRNSPTCSSWKNKIIVIGGEDLDNFYQSDVHFLDTDTLIWGKVNTLGQLMPPRAGHTTVALGKNLFVFGGFSDEQNLFDDIYNLDFETGCWTKMMTTGEGPSARFSMAGDSLDPRNGGVLVFIGGCNKNLEALDDMYYLRTGILTEPERDERRVEKVSLRTQLRVKVQEQSTTPVCDKALARPEAQTYAYKPVPATNFVQSDRQRIYLHEYQTPPGKTSFQAQVTNRLSDGYTIETVIDGKALRSTGDNDALRKQDQVEVGGSNAQDDHNLNNSPISSMQKVLNDRHTDGVLENSALPDNRIQATTAANMENLVISDAACLSEHIQYANTKSDCVAKADGSFVSEDVKKKPEAEAERKKPESYPAGIPGARAETKAGNVGFDGISLLEVLNLVYVGNDEIGPEEQLGTIIMEFNSGSKELYNRDKVDMSNPSIKSGDTVFVIGQYAGPVCSLEELDMQFDLFLGAFKGSIKVEFDPYHNQVWFEEPSIRSLDGTGEIFVVLGCLSNATVANLEIRLLDISAPADVHGVIAARNSELDQPACTSVLFWKSSAKKIEVERGGVIPLFRSRVGVPLVSKFYVDVSLSINGEHYKGTVSFDPHTKRVYDGDVRIPGKEAKVKVKVKWDARKNSVFDTYDSIYRKWADDEYDSEEDSEE